MGLIWDALLQNIEAQRAHFEISMGPQGPKTPNCVIFCHETQGVFWCFSFRIPKFRQILESYINMIQFWGERVVFLSILEHHTHTLHNVLHSKEKESWISRKVDSKNYAIFCFLNCEAGFGLSDLLSFQVRKYLPTGHSVSPKWHTHTHTHTHTHSGRGPKTNIFACVHRSQHFPLKNLENWFAWEPTPTIHVQTFWI